MPMDFPLEEVCQIKRKHYEVLTSKHKEHNMLHEGVQSCGIKGATGIGNES